MKQHGNQKYDTEAIKKAVRLYKTGKHSYKSAAERHGISITALRYWLSPQHKERMKEHHRRWRQNNREKDLERQKKYVKIKRYGKKD